jgi:hypothetical protein
VTRLDHFGAPGVVCVAFRATEIAALHDYAAGLGCTASEAVWALVTAGLPIHETSNKERP